MAKMVLDREKLLEAMCQEQDKYYGDVELGYSVAVNLVENFPPSRWDQKIRQAKELLGFAHTSVVGLNAQYGVPQREVDFLESMIAKAIISLA